MKNTTAKILKKPQWYKLIALYDEPAQKIMEVEQHDIVLTGMEYLSDGEPKLAVCSVPTSLPDNMGEPLRRLLEANLRCPVLVLTNNVQLAQLKRISFAEAKAILDKRRPPEEQKKEEHGKLIELPIERKRSEESGGGQAEQNEGENVRTEDS